jgi:hypothetical protein
LIAANTGLQVPFLLRSLDQPVAIKARTPGRNA